MRSYQFGVGKVYANQTFDASGISVALATPIELATLQEVSFDMSSESKTVHGANQFAAAIGRGKGTMKGKAKSGRIDGRMMSQLYFGRGLSTGSASIFPDFVVAIASTVTIVPPSSGVFAGDLGVFNYATGAELVRVASGPAAGEYSVDVSTGIYSFSAADVTSAFSISISYKWTKSTGGEVLTIKNELMGAAPYFAFDLITKYQGREFVLHLNRVMCNKLALNFKNDDFVMPDIEFEACADDSDNIGFLQFR